MPRRGPKQNQYLRYKIIKVFREPKEVRETLSTGEIQMKTLLTRQRLARNLNSNEGIKDTSAVGVPRT